MSPAFQVFKNRLQEDLCMLHTDCTHWKNKSIQFYNGKLQVTSSSSILSAFCFSCRMDDSTLATKYWLDRCNLSLNWTNSMTWNQIIKHFGPWIHRELNLVPNIVLNGMSKPFSYKLSCLWTARAYLIRNQKAGLSHCLQQVQWQFNKECPY